MFCMLYSFEIYNININNRKQAYTSFIDYGIYYNSFIQQALGIYCTEGFVEVKKVIKT